ncbi:MAG TPA: tail fiber domain-containing protein [Xanthobacteraceae bacterium]|jgi:hypothetical protein
MGGSVTTGSQQQTSQTTPWAPAAGAVQGLLGQLSAINTSLTPAELQAINQLTALGQQGNQFAPAIGGVASGLLSGGNATAQGPLINNAYQQYQQQLNPYLQSSFLDPRNTPGFGDALAAVNSDITNQINGQFASAGRDLSGANTQALARGLSQGEGQLIASQYNQNVANQLGAAGSLYGAGNTTGGLLTNLNQTALANQQAGIGAADSANRAQQYGPLLELQAQAQARGIPLQTLAAEMGIALPSAQAFGMTTSNMQQQTPLWQNIAGGLIGGAGILGGMGAFGRNGWLNLGG